MTRRVRGVCFAIALTLGAAAPLYGQGCSLCRDNTGATPPETQRAFRHGIVFLGTAAALLCGVTALVIRRYR